ncbi:hypothetical protein SAMN05660909_05660 [Chitinophaga terrae (ex Kim and Jung 2007)]|uniref:Uncharacterized protein n=1 Tax=Chitinophaga terrae (ex Kim and Jung 2007) TaxID=408074 RepID=A0A1H4GSM5_9BACT|nr:hypothetical protein [Chitinophaga terrae (ex Kim and Jung 2007)]GEP93709.1 hypothetical protein CTE07_53540 [Chitinophaga terrae (ex Kim and Jung 2007)]SEB12331.1 hypothetical protein SAMN05660909_05660 [Chitinophaga terrae (ex Kim and Jung 2007)]
MEILKVLILLFIAGVILVAILAGYAILDSILASVMRLLAQISFWVLVVAGIVFSIIIFRKN